MRLEGYHLTVQILTLLYFKAWSHADVEVYAPDTRVLVSFVAIFRDVTQRSRDIPKDGCEGD